MTKELSHVMLKLHSLRKELPNVGKKKKKKKPNMTKVLSDIILELYNIRMKSSNMIKKNKGTIECDK